MSEEQSLAMEAERAIQLLQVAVKSGNHLLALVDNVLDLSRLESGAAKLNITPINVNELMEDVAGDMEQRAQKKSIALSFINLASGSAPTLFADPVKLRQIVTNLVENALKFTPEEGKIEVTAEIQGDDIWELRVRDSGIGIEPAMQAVIFESFRQADQGQTRDHGGAGLGLAIVNKLCQLHRGSISVESEIGIGSVFCVRLPLSSQRP